MHIFHIFSYAHRGCPQPCIQNIATFPLEGGLNSLCKALPSIPKYGVDLVADWSSFEDDSSLVRHFEERHHVLAGLILVGQLRLQKVPPQAVVNCLCPIFVPCDKECKKCNSLIL
jgi:hypothetical protein